MNAPEIWIRSLVRRSGLLGPLLRFTRDRHESQLEMLRDEYRKTPVDVAPATIAGHQVRFHIANETDYTIVRALREEAFTDAVFAALRPGDVVWDIGGNIGFFSVPLAKAVGSEGRVYSFEPVPACRKALAENLTLNLVENVEIVPCAISNTAGVSEMATDEQVAAGTHQLLSSDSTKRGPVVEVQVMTGDNFVLDHPDAVPNVVKIDIEGYEFDALRGMPGVLENAACRAVFVEVHFGLLDKRGQRYAPLEIVKLFQDAGFAQVEWIDRSHLKAMRVAS